MDKYVIFVKTATEVGVRAIQDHKVHRHFGNKREMGRSATCYFRWSR